MKLWVEDRWGFKDPQSKEPAYFRPDAYTAAIEEAHRLGLRTIAHTKALKDWKGLIRAGVDATTHTVEDVPVDAELLALIKARPGFPNISALTSATAGRERAARCRSAARVAEGSAAHALKCPAFLETGDEVFEKRPAGAARRRPVVAEHRADPQGRRHDHHGQPRCRRSARDRLGQPHGDGSVRQLDRHDAERGDCQSATSVAAKFIGVDDRLGTLAARQGRRLHRAGRQPARRHPQHAARSRRSTCAGVRSIGRR